MNVNFVYLRKLNDLMRYNNITIKYEEKIKLEKSYPSYAPDA